MLLVSYYMNCAYNKEQARVMIEPSLSFLVTIPGALVLIGGATWTLCELLAANNLPCNIGAACPKRVAA